MGYGRSPLCVTWSILFLIFLLLWSGLPITPSLGQDDDLSHENNMLYLHYDEDQPAGSRYWMDTERTNVTTSYGYSVGLTGEFTLEFQLRPPLAHTLPFDGSVPHNLLVKLNIDAESLNPFPLKNVWIEWVYGDSVIHSDAPDNVDPGVIEFDLFIDSTAILIGSDVMLRVHFEVRPQTTFTFHTDTTSNVELKLLRDNDLDGDPDSTDPDDDNDGFTDDEEIVAGTDPLDPEDYPASNKNGDNGDGEDGGSGFVIYLLFLVVVIILISVIVLRRRGS